MADGPLVNRPIDWIASGVTVGRESDTYSRSAEPTVLLLEAGLRSGSANLTEAIVVTSALLESPARQQTFHNGPAAIAVQAVMSCCER